MKSAKSAVAVRGVVHDLRHGSFQAEIGAVPVQAAVIGKPLRVPAAIDLVVRLIVASQADDEFAFLVAFKSGARNGVENPIGPVAIFRVVTAPLHLDVIEILGIDLRAHVVGDIGVGHRDAVDEPAELVSAADVKHVVDHVGARNVVRDHGHAVGSIGARSGLNIRSAQQ